MSYQTSDAQEILAIRNTLRGKVPNIDQLAERAIAAGTSVEQFRAVALDKLPDARPIQNSVLADVPAKDWRKYSITRAIAMQLPGASRDGFENEMHQELLRHHSGGLSRPEGILVPDEAFARSHVAGTATLGGFLVEQSVASSEFIETLRNRSQVLNLGARVLNLQNPTHIPRQSGAGTVNWVGETTASTLTAINFTNLTLEPKGVSAFHQYSKQLLITGNPSIDALIRDDITQTLALAIDKAALHGAGGVEPVGLAGTSGINTVALGPDGLGLGNTTAFPALVSLEGLIANDNADVSSMAFLMRGGHRSKLRTVARFSGTDSPVFTSENGQGKVNGYRAECSGQILSNLTQGSATTICSAIYFGDWSQLLVANFGALDLVVDPFSGGANAIVKLYARRWVSIGVRHPESFAILGGVLDN
jgi:HK97 family phage major capsid protein